MRDGACIVFVEVRYRSSQRWGGGAASVTRAKQRRLINVAHAYLQRHPALGPAPCRFDIFALGGSRQSPQRRWIRNAFIAP